MDPKSNAERWLVCINWRSPEWIFELLLIADSKATQSGGVTFLDVSGFQVPNPPAYRRFWSDLSGKYVDLETLITERGHRFLRQNWNGACLTSRLQLTSLVTESELEQALKSSIISVLRSSFETKSIWTRILRSRVRKAGELAANSLGALLESEAFDLMYLANGRLFDQYCLLKVAHSQGLKVLHYELSEAPGRFFLRPYAPQDRLRHQAEILGLNEPHDDELEMTVALAWLRLRSDPKTGFNRFANQEFSESQTAKSPTVTFFNTSQDEMEFLGPDWHEAQWPSYLEAFSAIIKRCFAEGYACRIKVHPNLLNKSLRSFLKQVREIKNLSLDFPDLEVIWPTSPVSTYDLVATSEFVVVENSTVGIEASLMNKPVITVQSSWYADVINVAKTFGQMELDTLKLSEVKADPKGAARLVYFQYSRDPEAHYWGKDGFAATNSKRTLGGLLRTSYNLEFMVFCSYDWALKILAQSAYPMIFRYLRRVEKKTQIRGK